MQSLPNPSSLAYQDPQSLMDQSYLHSSVTPNPFANQYTNNEYAP